MSGWNERESIERDRLIFIRTFDLALARHIDMFVMMIQRKMRVNEWRVIVLRAAIPVNMLKRRKHKCGHECQKARNRERAPHHEKKCIALTLPQSSARANEVVVDVLVQVRAIDVETEDAEAPLCHDRKVRGGLFGEKRARLFLQNRT
ncbi:MAG TPA: hypothetical protein VG297_19155 [Bryobacteraceae bacterium]|nr:hypothetical protein [Bryobacteraceae bacterium]